MREVTIKECIGTVAFKTDSIAAFGEMYEDSVYLKQ